MRIFEILIVTTLFLYTSGFFIPRNKRPEFIYALPFLASVFLIAHIIIEKYRFQMVPLYIFTIIFLLISMVHIKKNVQKKDIYISRKRRIIELVMAFVGNLILVIATALPFLSPIVNLPKPGGPYSVGTIILNLTDHSRLETLTKDPDDHRQFIARIWYPAKPLKGSKSLPYKKHKPTTGSLLEAGSESPFPKGPPDIVFSHLKLMKSNAHLDASLASGSEIFPVIGFSCGFLSDPDEYQLFFEELASHGYVVFSLNQPYESQSVVHSDGRIVPFKQSHADEFFKSAKATTPLWGKFWKTTDKNKRESIAREIIRTETFLDRCFRIRTADMQFTLDELEKMNSGQKVSPFQGRLDMSHVGVFGHSGGGAVAGQCCTADERFTAGVNMDGFQFGDVINSEVQQPFMFMYSEMFADHNDIMIKNFQKEVYSLTIKGSNHMDFSDNPYVLPIIKKIGNMSGKILANRMADIVNSYLLAFFDKNLKGKNSSFLDGPSADYPEVIFNKNK
jgi:hypothetical protein